MINVAGAMDEYPFMRSASAEPAPAARAPGMGPKIIPHESMNPSPKFTYPFPGIGSFTSIVAMQVSIASIRILKFFSEFVRLSISSVP